MERVNRFGNDRQLVDDEIGDIAVVCFGEQVGTVVLARGLFQHPGNRDEFQEPIATGQGGPIEECPGDPAVAIDEWAVVGKREVQENRADDRMHERLAVGRVRESTRQGQAFGELSGGRGYVQDAVVAMIDHLDTLMRVSQPARGGRIVQGVLGQDAVQIQDCFRRQGVTKAFGDRAHGLEVVVDHPLARVPRLSPLAQHLLGDLPGCRGAFQLAGGDGLLDQRADQVGIAGLGIGNRSFDADLAGRVPIDAMDLAEDRIGEHEAEWAIRLVPERERLVEQVTGALDGEPPILMRETRRRRLVAELVPMQIASTRGRADGGDEQPSQMLGAGSYDRAPEVVVIGGGSAGSSCVQAARGVIWV